MMSTMVHPPGYWALQCLLWCLRWLTHPCIELYSGLLSYTFKKKIIICEYSKISIWRSSMNMCLVKRLWSSAVIRLFMFIAKTIYLCAVYFLYISDTSKNISWVVCQLIIYVTEKLFCAVSIIIYISLSKDIISICFISLYSISETNSIYMSYIKCHLLGTILFSDDIREWFNSRIYA